MTLVHSPRLISNGTIWWGLTGRTINRATNNAYDFMCYKRHGSRWIINRPRARTISSRSSCRSHYPCERCQICRFAMLINRILSRSFGDIHQCDNTDLRREVCVYTEWNHKKAHMSFERGMKRIETLARLTRCQVQGETFDTRLLICRYVRVILSVVFIIVQLGAGALCDWLVAPWDYERYLWTINSYNSDADKRERNWESTRNYSDEKLSRLKVLKKAH